LRSFELLKQILLKEHYKVECSQIFVNSLKDNTHTVYFVQGFFTHGQKNLEKQYFDFQMIRRSKTVRHDRNNTPTSKNESNKKQNLSAHYPIRFQLAEFF